MTMTMFASKTLAERNSDPEPWCGGPEWLRWKHKCSCGCTTYRPRPEFQHGKLEANPILTAVRDYIDVRRGNVEAALSALNNGTLTWGANSQQIAHAHRVLTLWLAVFA